MSVNLNRALNLSTNPAGLLAAAGAVYAVAVMVTNAAQNHGIIDPEVIVAAIAAVGALCTRQLVTPVADPRGRDGSPLGPVIPPAPPVTMSWPSPSAPTPPAWPEQPAPLSGRSLL